MIRGRKETPYRGVERWKNVASGGWLALEEVAVARDERALEMKLVEGLLTLKDGGLEVMRRQNPGPATPPLLIGCAPRSCHLAAPPVWCFAGGKELLPAQG